MPETSSVVELTVLYAGTKEISGFFYGANIYLGKLPLLVHWQGLSLIGMRAVAGVVVVSTGNDYYGSFLLLNYLFCLTLYNSAFSREPRYM